MVKEELIQRSPVRIFMKSIQGGLKPGEMGVIAAPSGLGKTSVLVQIALDKLLQGKKVIHVSFNQHTDYVLTWYEDIFDEFIGKKNLENLQDIKNDIVKNRVFMKFNQEGLSVDQILRSLKAMIKDGGFAAEYIIVDGYRFTAGEHENLDKIGKFARELGISLWFSCNTGDDPGKDSKGISPVITDFANLFDVIVVLEPRQDHIEFMLFRDRDVSRPAHPALRLDPKTLLILEE